MNHRYDFIALFEAKDANPNGDPDAGNLPRVDAETGHGLVTDVCLKRKLRNYVLTTNANSATLDIFIRERMPLNPRIAEACKEENLPDYSLSKGQWDKKKAKLRPQDEIRRLQRWLCERYYDVRAFGAVMSTGPNAGQIRGPVQIGFARSIDPIVTSEHTITRVTDVDKEEGEMGRKFTVPYALYRAHGFVNPFLAAQTGFSGEGENSDLELLWEALVKAFDFDASAARPAGSMAMRKLLVFKHATALGNAPAHRLFESVVVTRRPDAEVPRAFADYDVRLPEAGTLPAGVELIEKL